MNFRISGQKINIMKESKYLGMVMDGKLTFKIHMDTVKLKLNQANGLLAKLRHYINPVLSVTIYNMYCHLLGKTQTQVLQSIEKIQNKPLRIITSENSWEPSEKIRKESKIFKLRDIVAINNLRFVYDQMNKILKRTCESFFINKTSQNFYNARGNSLEVPQVETATYGSNSFILHAIREWNFFQNKFNQYIAT